jgi:hypothetical protein
VTCNAPSERDAGSYKGADSDPQAATAGNSPMGGGILFRGRPFISSRRRTRRIGIPVSNTEPLHENPRYDGNEGHRHRHEGRKDGSGARRAALVIHTVADVAALFLGLWIALYLLDANQANVFVEFVKDMADWLAWWSQDIFTMDTEGLRVLLNYGLPAVIYLLIGHGVAARVRHL